MRVDADVSGAMCLAHEVLDAKAMNEVVPVRVRELIRERIQALEQLELLLFLQSETRSWSAQELVMRLQLEPVLVEAAIAHLTHYRLLALESGNPPRYRYAPADVDRAVVEELAQAYEEARVEVLALISSDAVRRVRRRMRQLMARIREK